MVLAACIETHNDVQRGHLGRLLRWTREQANVTHAGVSRQVRAIEQRRRGFDPDVGVFDDNISPLAPP